MIAEHDKETVIFLENRVLYVLRHLLYDFISFTLFIVFLFACTIVGKFLYLIDSITGSRSVDRLIIFFEMFAK